MKYTIEELGFILYNNRSVNGVVKNFLPTDINPLVIIRIEKNLDKVKNNFLSDNRMVEMMEQLGITEEEFEEYASKGFCVELINNWYNFFRCKIEDFVIIEEDRIVIFTKKLSDYLVNSIEEVNNNLTKFMNLYSFIEYDITENEFLIHCESDKRYFMNAS